MGNAEKTVTATFQANITQYPLTVTKNGTGAGTVTSSPTGISCGTDCSENYTKDASVTLTARANSDSKFSGWSNGCTGTSTTCTVTMNAAKTVNAKFDAKAPTCPTFGLTPAEPYYSNTQLYFNWSSQYATTAKMYMYNEARTKLIFSGPSPLQMTNGGPVLYPDSRWFRIEFSGPGGMTPCEKHIVINNRLTVNKMGTGSGTVASSPIGTISCGASCTAYPNGTLVVVTATPAADSTVSWSGCDSSSGNTFNVTMTKHKVGTATLTKKGIS